MKFTKSPAICRNSMKASMSRLAGIAQIFLAVLVLLIPDVAGLSESGVLVSFTQDGVTGDNFDINKTIIYNINLLDARDSMRYDVTLTAGPDQNNIPVSITDTKCINAKKGASNSVQFAVNFADPQFRQGEFARWLEDANRTEKWSGAWWKVDVTDFDPFTPDIHKSDYSGSPGLLKPIWALKEAKVTPAQGTSSAAFNYEVQLLANALDNITLEVAPSKDGPWTDVGVQRYTMHDSWQVLKWDNVTLPFEFGAAAYRFTGRQQGIFYGPFWPVTLEFRNSSVTPKNGFPDERFAYALELRASHPIDVGLQVKDVATGEYRSAGRRQYLNSSSWEQLEWKNVRMTDQDSAIGLSNYYFTVHYPGLDAALDDPSQRTIFSGPKIGPTPPNASVSPLNGTAYTKYTFAANLSLRQPECDVGLWILPPGSKIWIPKGLGTYTQENRTLVWPNITFEGLSDSLGVARYKFTVDNAILGEFEGPNFDVAFKDVEYKKNGTNKFDYYVQVSSTYPRLCIDMVAKGDDLEYAKINKTQCYVSDKQEWVDMVWKNEKRYQEWYFIALRDCQC